MWLPGDESNMSSIGVSIMLEKGVVLKIRWKFLLSSRKFMNLLEYSSHKNFSEGGEDKLKQS